MSRFLSGIKVILFTLLVVPVLTHAESCETATQELNSLEKVWSNKSQDPEKNKVDGSDAVYKMGIIFSVFDKTNASDSCRPSLFRSMVRSAAALAPFDGENDGPTNLEEILNKNPSLQSVFESTLKDYTNQYSNQPRVSCRAQMILRDVKAHRCDRAHKQNCFNQGPDLTQCRDKGNW